MAYPSHYIANPDNAHIDTRDFQLAVRQLLTDVISAGEDAEYPCDRIYDLIESRTSRPPNEPADEQLICRYLSPKKFIGFVSDMSVYFCAASKFEDQRDSILPMDYHNAVILELTRAKLDHGAWDRHILDKRSRWLVSCWTKLDGPYDDSLLWHSYADGESGVGVTVRYGLLRDFLRQAVKNEVGVNRFYAGEISYENENSLRIAPFNKRNIFRNEKEIRFVTHSSSRKSLSVKIENIKSQLGLRLSPQSSDAHRDAVRDIWRRFGGSEKEIHIAGD